MSEHVLRHFIMHAFIANARAYIDHARMRSLSLCFASSALGARRLLAHPGFGIMDFKRNNKTHEPSNINNMTTKRLWDYGRVAAHGPVGAPGAARLRRRLAGSLSGRSAKPSAQKITIVKQHI